MTVLILGISALIGFLFYALYLREAEEVRRCPACEGKERDEKVLCELCDGCEVVTVEEWVKFKSK